MSEKKRHWLDRRLSELSKTKGDFAAHLGILQSHVSVMINGGRKIQASEIKKAAEFLEFDRTAFLDFISGDISEDELWNAKPPMEITQEDLDLLKAVKTIATRPQTTAETKNSSQSSTIQTTKENER